MTLGEPLPDGTTALTLKRPALARLLAEEAGRRGVEVRYDARVVAVHEAPTAPRVKGRVSSWPTGPASTGDLLVAADGVRSRIRPLVDPAAPEGRYVGLTNFGGITRQTPLAEQLPLEAWQMVFGRHAFFGAHRTPDGDVVWFVNAPRAPIGPDERAATSTAQWQQWLVELLEPDAGPGAELVRTGELELAGDSTYDLGHVPRWHRGRIVLIGDAAHAPRPSSGQGASMALEDAVELARCLRDTDRPEAAFAAYEATPTGAGRADRQGRGALSSSKTPGRFGRVVRDAADAAGVQVRRHRPVRRLDERPPRAPRRPGRVRYSALDLTTCRRSGDGGAGG